MNAREMLGSVYYVKMLCQIYDFHIFLTSVYYARNSSREGSLTDLPN